MQYMFPYAPWKYILTYNKTKYIKILKIYQNYVKRVKCGGSDNEGTGNLKRE